MSERERVDECECERLRRSRRWYGERVPITPASRTPSCKPDTSDSKAIRQRKSQRRASCIRLECRARESSSAIAGSKERAPHNDTLRLARPSSKEGVDLPGSVVAGFHIQPNCSSPRPPLSHFSLPVLLPRIVLVSGTSCSANIVDGASADI
ncbi:glutamyl amidotransferase [Pseudozyma hubeiensis SY62]|uniref:Glutamyl amidotransferase n=1 Tax=Pseudozyma hubeiensis (strain SY62) TaxID=1305764 RepID=R9P5U7_PSEHS|nr:glutamyl amidotransferase [Pseudozyma hubeiensis SY62]GAC96778.1 glutamyl amidotransferase [Pseudozyma hubeiensis SY62]